MNTPSVDQTLGQWSGLISGVKRVNQGRACKLALASVDMASGAERLEAGDSEQDEEEDVYEVEKIIDMRVEEVS